jgi:putative Ca2+/H+ antiporter (TMEM165/GDT1 family)
MRAATAAALLALGAGALTAAAAAAAAAPEDALPGAPAPAPLLTGGKASSLLPATVNGFTMTVATELGDKTFMIAAIMAMRYNRLLVFSGAAGALLVMTVLSVGIGVALPNLMPKQYTHYAAAALFAYFGVKLLNEAQGMPADAGGEHSELAEAEEELAAKLGTPSAAAGGGGGGGSGSDGGSAGDGSSSHEAVDVEHGDGGGGEGTSGASSGGHRSNGNGGSTPTLGPAASGGALVASVSEDEVDPSAKSHGTKRAVALALGNGSSGSGEAAGSFWASLRKDWPILTQAFMITFLAEWGDRSQIATIAMAAAQHPVGGALSGAARGSCSRALGCRLTHAHTPPSPPPPFLSPPCSRHGRLCRPRWLHCAGSDWRQAAGLSHQRAPGGALGRHSLSALCHSLCGGGPRRGRVGRVGEGARRWQHGQWGACKPP